MGPVETEVNNDGRGLYSIGERIPYPCGCVAVAGGVGYTHYVHPNCEHDNKTHPVLKGYAFKAWDR
ncbi:hypothetical protein LCGC14_2397790 [marine sediment metagenome]|uniref:Uncharacterized protein n=1 Tax=marine sediment metagenome TaxID=412755 RepID=A0A0F9EQN1_9ZZZZ